MKIQISQPCHESFAAMQAENKNARFCGSCQKSVIDFSHFSDAEIIEYLKNSKGKVCGRLNQTQLERTLNPSPRKTPNGIKAFYSILLSSLLSMGAGTAKGEVSQDQKIQTDSRSQAHPMLQAEKDSEPILVKGKVRDQNTKEGLSMANVTVANTMVSVMTDDQGNFEFTLPEGMESMDEIVLWVYYGEYDYEEVVLKRNKLKKNIKININNSPSKMMMQGKVAYIEEKPASWIQYILQIFE